MSRSWQVLDIRDLADELKTLSDREDDEVDPLDEEEQERIAALRDLEEQFGGNLHYQGNMLEPMMVHEDYFEQYAQELAEDIGAISRDASWPLNRIDWEAAAEDLKMDYSSYEFEGSTYYVRQS